MSGFKERQLDSPLCVCVVCCDMSGVEIHDGNLASTKILSSGAFLMVSCKKKKSQNQINERFKAGQENLLTSPTLPVDLLLMQNFIPSCAGHLNTGLYRSSNAEHFLIGNQKIAFINSTTDLIREKSLNFAKLLSSSRWQIQIS